MNTYTHKTNYAKKIVVLMMNYVTYIRTYINNNIDSQMFLGWVTLLNGDHDHCFSKSLED